MTLYLSIHSLTDKIYQAMPSVSDVRNDRTINENWTQEDVEGSGRQWGGAGGTDKKYGNLRLGVRFVSAGQIKTLITFGIRTAIPPILNPQSSPGVHKSRLPGRQNFVRWPSPRVHKSRSPVQLNFVRWPLIFPSSQYGTWFRVTLRRLGFWDGY